MGVQASLRVEMYLSGAWTDVSGDLVGSEPMRARRGTQGTGPGDIVASTGMFEFSLRNDAGNSGGRQGYYSPNHANCRTDFGYGAWVRLIITYGTDRTRWTGRLRVIDPAAGRYRVQRTRCVAHDAMSDLADNDIQEVDPQVNKTEVEVLQAVVAALPTEAQPLSVFYDVAVDTLPFALDDVQSGMGAKGLGVLERVVSSVRGLLFVSGSGLLTYQNRNTRAVQLSQYTFTESDIEDVVVPTGLDNVFNHILITLHPRTPSASTVVVWSHTGTLSLAAGETVELWGDYFDPDRPEIRIGAYNFVDPVVATDDYVFNAAADGSGTNLTGSMSVTAAFFAARVKFTITNNHATLTAHKILLQGRGSPIYDKSPITKESKSTQSYGKRQKALDWPYSANESLAQAEADFLEASYRLLSNQVTSLTFNPQNSAALMAQALDREIGDVVSLSETVTIPTAVSGYIQWIELTVLPNRGTWLMCTFGLAPRVVSEETHTDTLTLTDSFSDAQTSPVQFLVGTAQVGLSEVA